MGRRIAMPLHGEQTKAGIEQHGATSVMRKSGLGGAGTDTTGETE